MQKMYKKCAGFITGCMLAGNLFAQTCDTVKYEEAITGGWSAMSYESPNFFEQEFGYANGADYMQNKEVANYFDVSGTSYGYILGAMIKFGASNSNTPESLDKQLFFKVYADNSGVPGSLLVTSQPKTMRQIKADVDAGAITKIDFPATALPASKKFYVSVDIRNFEWRNAAPRGIKDTLWVAGTTDNEIPGNTAWVLSTDSAWTIFPDIYYVPGDVNNDLNINLWIFPYVSINNTGCGVLPVNLLSFTAARSSNDVILNWEVSNEINMKGYEVEKADNTGSFRSIAFTPATNNLKNQRYSSTDRNAFSTASTVQYRLKQVNADGSFVYSRIISLKRNSALTDIVFENPVHDVLKLQLTLTAAEKVDIRLYDSQGRLVAAQPAQTYMAGTSSIQFANIAGLASGTYFLKVNTGTEQSLYKVIKR